MLRRINYCIFRNLSSITRQKLGKRRIIPKKITLWNGGHLFLYCNIYINLVSNKLKVDPEDDLKAAFEEGEEAIITLIDELKDLIVTASEDYRNCLVKQIELTQMFSSLDPFAEAWDEVSKYRTIGDALSKELDEYVILFKTIGQMAYDQTLISIYLTDTISSDLNDKISARYKELEVLLINQLEENKKKEIELLRVKRDSILKGVG